MNSDKHIVEGNGARPESLKSSGEDLMSVKDTLHDNMPYTSLWHPLHSKDNKSSSSNSKTVLEKLSKIADRFPFIIDQAE